MNENIADKFAGLFAACAVNGETAELQKEAVAHNLVKSAAGNPFVSTVQNVLSNPYVYVPAATAAAGGALGYGTSKKKDKKRNALHYALMGGLTGLGGVAAARNMPIFGGGDKTPAAGGGEGAATAGASPAVEQAKMMQEHANETAPGLIYGKPGTTLAPRATGTTAAVLGGLGGDALNKRMFRKNVTGELKNVSGDMAGTLGFYGNKDKTQRLTDAINDLLNAPDDPLKVRGPAIAVDRDAVLNNAKKVVSRGDLGPMSKPGLRAQNMILMQELSKLDTGFPASKNLAAQLHKYHAGKKMTLGRRGLGWAGSLLGLPVNYLVDAIQNATNASAPTQEQPK
jgi:hypothetical protein